ncbi:MAG: hypothetical protein JRI23_24830 [Deltaproteobacteria bacterium]|jgi:hypothetical protein|nr:hypothetical protein [Deltaproteobacteria bacterium]MBW2535238.1 hypothetical protein [Deltaproteobacteria bacterium]
MQARLSQQGTGISVPTGHPILEAALEGPPYSRLVDELVIHHGLISFRQLCERAVPPSTRYLVFDLDKTLHLGRNLGELLGWELGALQSYGEDFLEAIEEGRGRNRLVLDPQRPLATVRYFLRGMRLWTYPGLLYLLTVKLGTRSARVRPWLYRWFGRNPVEAIQDVPRMAVMHQLADVPMATLRLLATRIWRRYAADQVVQEEDVAWLRRRCPRLRILLSSASPQPVVEVAARELDVDDVFYTAVEQREGYLSAPYAMSRLFLLGDDPKRISPPSEVVVNAGAAKMGRLLERYPDFMDPGVETIGITDTSYGEDHSWSSYFDRVVDINSPSPFVPIIAADSPLSTIHSAKVMTRAELSEPSLREAREGAIEHGGAGTAEGITRYAASQLASELAGTLDAVESLAASFRAEAAALRPRREALQAQLDSVQNAIERDVIRFDVGSIFERPRALRRLRRHLRKHRSIQVELLRVERPLSQLSCSLDELLASSRARLLPR